MAGGLGLNKLTSQLSRAHGGLNPAMLQGYKAMSSSAPCTHTRDGGTAPALEPLQHGTSCAAGPGVGLVWALQGTR